MRLGVQLTRYDTSGGSSGVAQMLVDVARSADEAGIDVLSAPDHFLQVPYVGAADLPMLEGYSTLAFLAAHSRSVHLQLLVSGVTSRSPGVLAKTVATLDVLSGGRAVLGLGAGWYAREHHALGLPFPPLRDRFELLEEALQVVRQMWSDDDGPFEGTHHRLAETICSPKPLHPVPVMVDGVDERKALRVVARYADACHLFAGGEQGASFVAGKLDALRAHCESERTSYGAISKTILWTPTVDPDDPEEFLEAMRAMADVGVQEVHVRAAERPAELVRGLGARVVPALERL